MKKQQNWKLKSKSCARSTLVGTMEQYTRRNNVGIFGVKEQPRGDTDKQVLHIFKEIISVPITINEIDRNHRTGSYKRNGKPRPITVKFTSYRSRALTFSSKKKLKGAGTIIREDLTKQRLDILNQTIKKSVIKNVWTSL